jgi:nucleotide-binding universal stress UspA family protein
MVAAAIAKRSGATLEIMHANVSMGYAPLIPDTYVSTNYAAEEYREEMLGKLEALAQEKIRNHPDYTGISINLLVEDGFLHEAVREGAREENCDLIVMGTKGISGSAEFFIGSNTEKVIRTAPCPVLAIPKDNKTTHPNNVVFCTTLRPDQEAAFRELAGWQQLYGFKVNVLYLNNPSGFATDEATQDALDAFCKFTGLTNTELTTSNNVFNEEQAILNYAAQVQADLIVMGTHQRRGLSHMVFGSITEDTANHSSIPVLAIPLKS